MSSNVVGRFVGGSPAIVALRLIVVSFIVGVILETFGFSPVTLFTGAVRAARRLFELGFTDGASARAHPPGRRDGGGPGVAGAVLARFQRTPVGDGQSLRRPAGSDGAKRACGAGRDVGSRGLDAV
jgi:hypothetical protein